MRKIITAPGVGYQGQLGDMEKLAHYFHGLIIAQQCTLGKFYRLLYRRGCQIDGLLL